jgi:hypothetical protein
VRRNGCTRKGRELRANEAGNRSETQETQDRRRQPRGSGDNHLHAPLPPSQWKSIRTPNAIERRIKTQTVLPTAETAAMLFWALLASGQITMRKADGWQSLADKPSIASDSNTIRDGTCSLALEAGAA